MPTREFSQEILRDILWEDQKGLISTKMIDTSRWSIDYLMTFRYEGKVYQIAYSQGATEQQDEPPFEYGEPFEAIEVHEVEKTVKVWEPV